MGFVRLSTSLIVRQSDEGERRRIAEKASKELQNRLALEASIEQDRQRLAALREVARATGSVPGPPLAITEALRGPRIRAIIEEVAAKHGLARTDLVKINGYASRKRPIIHARQEAFWRLLEFGLSSPRAAQVMGGFDHSTVIYGAFHHCRRNGMVYNDKAYCWSKKCPEKPIRKAVENGPGGDRDLSRWAEALLHERRP